MPELPEVENLRIGLARVIKGQKILRIEVRKTKLVSGKSTKRTASEKKKSEFIKGIKREHFLSVDRRAKNLIFKLTNEKTILVHLKMSGQFAYKASNKNSKIVTGGHPIEISETKLPNKHTHIIFELEKGTLFYNDTRMFGYVLYHKDKKTFEDEAHFKLLGVEPLSPMFTPKYFHTQLKKYKGKIKAVLMDQKIVTGLGNIYADESLFEAKIHPERSASSISNLEASKLYKAIVRILKQAIKVGGSSVATYRLLDKTQGNYAREHKVYGKAGEKCSRCKKPLKKIVVAGRTTVFCPNCQI